VSISQRATRGEPRLEALIRSADRGKLEESERGAIVAAAREANAEPRRELTRVRSFRNVLLVSAAILTLASIGVGVLGIVQPDAMPLLLPARQQSRLPNRGGARGAERT
jgi:hypothetical protein